MKKPLQFCAIFAIAVQAAIGAHAAPTWSETKANDWYKQQPWLVGANYTPATAINELEMWQPDTFDPKTIDQELGWAQGIGMNTMRVFLQDQLWTQDPKGFKKRIGEFLKIADKHKIKPLFVLFDSCWDPNPKLGKQHDPVPGVHNSGWVQSPGADELRDTTQYPKLHAYVTGVVGAFAHDRRVLGWDVWNEPDNGNDASYGPKEPKNKVELITALLPQVFEWAREAKPDQPLTSGVWKGDWSNPDTIGAMEKLQLSESDVVTFHNYGSGEDFERCIKSLQRFNRPILCTEYMARGANSTFQGSLPIAKQYRVGAMNWGLVAGKTQTFLPWDSWQHPYTDRDPAIWFHEVFHTYGAPYRPAETVFIKEITASVNGE
ncbi:MAG: 1,4-beta-xylanase [Capsulimonas sp.]|uniref:1,4-beta-xylanase n=1 Tax=Capsulimonas sp. TaxID=2494211 RepID=UPI0032677CC5